MKKAFGWLLLLCLLSAMALAEQPAWEYPLVPEILANKRGYITLANKTSLLGKDFEPTDLVAVKLNRTVDDELRLEAYEALTQMFEAAKEAGYTLYVKSGYRSYQTQKTMYANRMDKVGKDDGVVAYPGASDHQTGLGVDILNKEWSKKTGMTVEFGKTEEAKWMYEHCQDFGFILRYMEDKEDITGIIYEPWHFRYVGVEAATYIMANHLSLEEFTEEWQAYVVAYEAAGGDFQVLLKERARPRVAYVVGYSEDGEPEISTY